MIQVLGIIPARGGSKGVHRKNLRRLRGRALIEYTIEASRESRLISQTVVSTEDKEVATTCVEAGCHVLQRPASLAEDSTPMLSVIRHVLNTVKANEGLLPEVTVLLQPTSPLRQASHIDEAINLLLSEGADSVVGVSPVPHQYHPFMQFEMGPDLELSLHSGRVISELPTQRQDLTPTFSPNGAVYVFMTSLVVEENTLYGKKCLAYLMPAALSVDIDSEEDLHLAERQLRLTGDTKNIGAGVMR